MEAAVSPTIGLIAGSGVFPLRFAESAKRSGHRVVCVAHEGDADRSLESVCDEVTWVHLGQLGKMVKAFRKAGVDAAAMAGGVAKVNLWGGLRPDLMALKHAPKLKRFDNDSLLRAVASMFEEEGVRIVDPAPYCPDLMARKGAYGRYKPDSAMEADIRLGVKVSNAISRAEVGQTVCTKGGVVVAVEGMEGTDRCIRRAGELVGKGVVVVKFAMPEQDMRFDAPCIGPGTVNTCVEIGASALVFEAARSVILEEKEIVARADAAKLALVGADSDGSWR
ncbi:LpxI family protein [Vulgatibacter incomptus]|uniref:UDP-2,3-diacylglucosamine pyrophosphatase n=1 Tax=Vulgatibacter incomptus TaxID=1391653 RepID=A0A0K1PEG3_9BACT|nr:UDP-2,3-diacylglucosamine diphosphatase LpxI [Vulgatibacter incomptus]AKU91514.1 UDP-2,3-diacylglucosamine pyrophosphatase [Vulgatibacter incomptus]